MFTTIGMSGGVPVIELENGLLPKLGKTKETGTRVNFLPDPEIFEKTRFASAELKSRLHETAYLNPELTIEYEDRRDGKERDGSLSGAGRHCGLCKGSEQEKKRPSTSRYILKGESEGITVEAAFQYVRGVSGKCPGLLQQYLQRRGGHPSHRL